MSRRRPRWTPGLLLVFALAIVPGPASVQAKVPPYEIRAEIEQSRLLLATSLHRLDDSPEALRLTWDAYVLLRAAHGGIVANLSGARFPDPLYQAVDPLMASARSHVLIARAALSDPDRVVDGTPAEVAGRNIVVAIAKIDAVLELVF